MIIPAKRQCDLCKNNIPEGRHFCQVLYPLDPQDKAALGIRRPEQFDSILGDLHQARLESATYQFEMCRECVDALLPMLSNLKSEYIQRFADERRRRTAETA